MTFLVLIKTTFSARFGAGKLSYILGEVHFMYSASIVLTCGEGISFRATETKSYITGLTDSIIDPDLVSI